MLEDIADARIPWMADVLVGSIDNDYNDAADIFLKEASIFEVSKKIPSAVDKSLSKQQKEFFLRQQLTAIQRELLAVQRGVSDSTTSSSANDGPMSELDDDDQHKVDDSADLKKIETIQSGIEERKVGMREWRRLKSIPHGNVKMSYVRPLVLFHLRLHLDTLCSLRANPNSMAQLVNVLILYSLRCYSRQNVPHNSPNAT